MTYNVFSGTLNPTHFTSLYFTAVVLTKYRRVTDGRTDGQTDRQTELP